MNLDQIAMMLPQYEANRPVEGTVTGLAYNSKVARSGELFFCLRGHYQDGHQFAAEAVKRGVAALVVEEFLPLDILQFKVPDSRKALAVAAKGFYGYPETRLGLVGVTGTNGKTTTTFMIRSLLQQLGRPVGLVGTVFNQLTGEPEPSSLTTPDSVDLWNLLAQAVEERCDWVVMEVSSHALSMGRVDPAVFDIAVVTNITRDHFDYHKNFHQYRASKARLVRELPSESRPGRPRAAVLNADDPAVIGLEHEIEAPVVTFGIENKADVMASDIAPTSVGTQFHLHLPGTTPTKVRLPMPGLFNVSNALAAAAVGWLAGVPLPNIVAGLETCPTVPGRTESIDEGQDFQVMVDFAHNPDALAKLASLRPADPRGRTILVFGAEGGKDVGKRPLMGAAAAAADYVIITSDNMYSEDPLDVARQIAKGLKNRPHEIMVDRREAITRAINLARIGDLVLIAGKGHEQTWIYQGRRVPLDDRQVVRSALRSQLAQHRN